MIKAIIYYTSTNHTLAYAKMLSKDLEIPYYSLIEAKEKLNKNDEVIYLSWICAGKIKKLKQVKDKYKIKCIGMIGAYPKTEKYTNELKTNNSLHIPCFYLRGGIDYTKLKGINKITVKMVGKVISKDNAELAQLFEKGGNFVKEGNLKEIIDFIKK